VLIWMLDAYCFPNGDGPCPDPAERSARQGGIVRSLEHKVAEANFDELRWKADPHFLTPGLDRIALAGEDPGGADRGIENLSQALRRMLGAARVGELPPTVASPATEPVIDLPPALESARLPALLLLARATLPLNGVGLAGAQVA
jgi:hypothetical protein